MKSLCLRLLQKNTYLKITALSRRGNLICLPDIEGGRYTDTTRDESKLLFHAPKSRHDNNASFH